MFWSHGLKERVGINEKTDEEIAMEQDEQAVIVYQMLDGEWRRSRHNVPRVLAAAEDNENIREVIESIEELDFYSIGSEDVSVIKECLDVKEIREIANKFRDELRRGITA